MFRNLCKVEIPPLYFPLTKGDRKGVRVVLLSMVMILLGSHTASACPTCYGAADSPMVDGMNMAILAMLGITGCVLAAISSFFIMMRRRLKRLRNVPPHRPFVNGKGILQWNKF